MWTQGHGICLEESVTPGYRNHALQHHCPFQTAGTALGFALKPPVWSLSHHWTRVCVTFPQPEKRIQILHKPLRTVSHPCHFRWNATSLSPYFADVPNVHLPTLTHNTAPKYSAYFISKRQLSITNSTTGKLRPATKYKVWEEKRHLPATRHSQRLSSLSDAQSTSLLFSTARPYY